MGTGRYANFDAAAIFRRERYPRVDVDVDVREQRGDAGEGSSGRGLATPRCKDSSPQRKWSKENRSLGVAVPEGGQKAERCTQAMYGLMGPFATAFPIAGSVARAALRGYWQRPT